MFRRRRADTFYRPPASSAWWADQAGGEPPFDPRYPAGRHPADQHSAAHYPAAHYPAAHYPAGQHAATGSADQAPPLPASDPFGGWPVFGADGGDPTDAVIGQPDPTAGWSVPAAPGFPYGQPAGPGRHSAGPDTRRDPYLSPESSPASLQPPPAGSTPSAQVPGFSGFPGEPLAGFPAGSPDLAQVPDPASAPAAPIAAFPPAPGEHAEPDEWLPLLTHEEQRVQAELAQLRPVGMDEELEDEADGGQLPPAQLGRPGTDRPARNGKRRATRARKTLAPATPMSTNGTPWVPAENVEDSAGMPAQPAAGHGGPGFAASVRPLGGPSTGPANWHDPVQPRDPMAAAALAGAFAADYLSWDEANPMRRGEVLTQYLPSDVTGSVAGVALLGWSGKGRQRSEFALPGAVSRDEEGRLIVDVRVRVTPYRPVGQSAEPASAPSDELEVAGVPSVAPAPTARGWKSLDSHWIRLAVPVVREHGRLVVDTWDEQLSHGSAQPDGESADADEWHDQPAAHSARPNVQRNERPSEDQRSDASGSGAPVPVTPTSPSADPAPARRCGQGPAAASRVAPTPPTATQTTGGTVPRSATGNRVTPNTTGARATRAARGAGKGRPSARGSR